MSEEVHLGKEKVVKPDNRLETPNAESVREKYPKLEDYLLLANPGRINSTENPVMILEHFM
jgi:hypothetical protein